MQPHERYQSTNLACQLVNHRDRSCLSRPGKNKCYPLHNSGSIFSSFRRTSDVYVVRLWVVKSGNPRMTTPSGAIRMESRLAPCVTCDKPDCGATAIVPNVASENRQFNQTA